MIKLIAKFIGFIVICLLSISQSKSQELSIGYGLIYTATYQSERMFESKSDFMNSDAIYYYTYEHYLKNSKFSLSGTFIKFKGETNIKFREGSVLHGDNSLIGVGFSGVNVSRFDIGINYNVMPKRFMYYFKPFVTVGIQTSKKTGVEIYSEIFQINGPEYYELEPVTLISYNKTHLIPSLGFKTGILLFHRIDLFLYIQGACGFKSYQNLYFKYAFKGVNQKTAVFESRGTGLFCNLGIGYRFAKLIRNSN